LDNQELAKQGYVHPLYRSGVLVAGRTAQACSNGVQTLRQLLHPEGAEGKALATPMLGHP